MSTEAEREVRLCDACADHHSERCDTPYTCHDFKRLRERVTQLEQEVDKLRRPPFADQPVKCMECGWQGAIRDFPAHLQVGEDGRQ